MLFGVYYKVLLCYGDVWFVWVYIEVAKSYDWLAYIWVETACTWIEEAFIFRSDRISGSFYPFFAVEEDFVWVAITDFDFWT